MKEEQINAILFGRHYKGTENKREVTFNEIIDFVKKNGLKPRYDYSRNSLTDGFKFYEEDKVWYCGFQERGIIFNERVFMDYDKGLEYIVRTLLKLSGMEVRE